MTYLSPTALLTREELAAALTERGYRLDRQSLADYASRGGGPAYSLRREGNDKRWRTYYVWGEALAWAKARAIRLGREVPDQAA